MVEEGIQTVPTEHVDTKNLDLHSCCNQKTTV
jgi:hypothetical protein